MSTQPTPPLGHVTGWASEPAWSVSGSKIASGDALIGIAIGCSAAELICQSHNAEIAAVRAVAERAVGLLKRIAGDGTYQNLMCDNDGRGCPCVDEATTFLAELEPKPEGAK